MSTDNHKIPNIQSPPSLIPISVEALTMEIIDNAHIWLTMKNIKPNYVFATNRKYIDKNTFSDTTIFSHLDNLNFSDKVIE